MNLADLGWSEFFQLQMDPERPDNKPARVCRQDKNQFHLLSEQGPLNGVIPQRLRKAALSKADLPTVGDWVVVSPIEGGEDGTVQIEALLERKSKFSRKEAGDVMDEQVVAANIDTVFIVSALDNEFNPSRIERYLLLSWDSGAQPVLILNKTDICTKLERKLESIRLIAQGAPIHRVSATEGEGLEVFTPYLSHGSTCAFLGSSGVGKSTIINALLGFEKFETGAVREEDNRGRHTTTFREMVQTPQGGMIIDTPGMREIQLWASSASITQSFEDVETLASQCKFRDCAHLSEPGCAVNKAVADGTLDERRLSRYFKLVDELEHFESQQNVAARAEKKQSRRRYAKPLKNQIDEID